MPTTGKMYFGATLIAEPGMQWEYDRPYPPDYGTNSTYTIPGTLQATFTTSGTYTPAPGVSTVHVMVVGGGGNGAGGITNSTTGGGGSGGGVRVYRNVPVTGPVAVTIGAAGTQSSFGALTAPGGVNALQWTGGYGLNFNGDSAGGRATTSVAVRTGQNGPTINGTAYAGGGGAGGPAEYSDQTGSFPGPGGAGGGGYGANSRQYSGVSMPPGPQMNGGGGGAGTGGGGGGGGATPGGVLGVGGAGGSGRVMIWTEDI